MDTVAQPAVSQSPLGSMSGCTANNPAAHHQQLEVPLELLLQAASKQGHKVPAGQLQQHKLLAGLSHVHLNGLQLTELHSLRMCPSLQVLYVYDNLLSSIGGISSSRLLTHLYCQNNQLTSLQGLTSLPLLQKLYVQHNRLACIDCLTKAHHLEELHVSDQHPWPACSSAGCDRPAGLLDSCAGQQQHSHPQVLHVTRGQLSAAHQCQQHQQGDGHISSGDGSAAVHQPPQQQQQEKEPLVLYNDGCLVHHTFNSTPPTPPTPLTALQDFTAAQQAAEAGSAAADTGLEGMATSVTSSSSSSSGTPAVTSSTGSTPGDLWFEPPSLAAIAGSLRVLTAANCGITDPTPLAVLTRLRVLDLSGNSIASLSVLLPVLAGMQQLQDLDLRGNPCTSSCSSASKYRDCIILAAADSLEQLDGEEVTPAHRAFLHALHSRRAKARQQQQLLQEQEQLSQQVSSMHMGGGDEHPSANTADAAADQEYGSHMGAIAAGHHTHAVQQSPWTRAARCGAQGALGPSVAGMKLQLAAALQPCRAGAPRPSPAAGFKPSPKKAAMCRGPAAAAGAVECDAGGFDGHL